MGKNNFQSPNDTFKVPEYNSLVTRINGSKYCEQLFFKLFLIILVLLRCVYYTALSQNTFFWF